MSNEVEAIASSVEEQTAAIEEISSTLDSTTKDITSIEHGASELITP